MWKKFAREYFTFSRKDRVGVIVLISLIGIVLGAPLIFPFLKKPAVNNKEISDKVAQLNNVAKDSFTEVKQTYYVPDRIPERDRKYSNFYFDPNTISLEGWMKLGISEKAARTILKYRDKGGKFYKPEDIFKIYTISRPDAERLLPYIRIQQTERKFEQPQYNRRWEKDSSFSRPYGKNPVSFDINSSDTSYWKSLPGIGSRLAQRIVNYREKLGGFVSVDQVAETRFLPDSTFRKIKVYLNLQEGNIRKLNINAVTADELKNHPYINFNLANAIVEFRKQHGEFKDLNELKKIHLMDDELFSRLESYLSLQ